MFQINRTDNRLFRLEERNFAELNIREREHLQEWLAHMPDALGEELLIIQKEFDGFDETRERLDLLALDKSGQLVIIENKLDDSGRDVVWQALKYTAYCSNLKTAQIIEIYQEYLTRYCGGGDASEMICEYLDLPELDGVALNKGISQRIMLVAAKFRKEVTATVLWLLSNEISMQCFKATPYTFGDDLLLDIKQIIPTPEAEEFMINMSSKENEEKLVHRAQRRSYILRLKFWEQTLDALNAAKIQRFQNISASKSNWLAAGMGVSGCKYSLVFLQEGVRVEVNLERIDGAENKWIFDQLYKEKEQIESEFGDKLEWLRLDDNKASRIKYSKIFEGFNEENWPEMIEWLIKHFRRLEPVFNERVQKLSSSLKV